MFENIYMLPIPTLCTCPDGGACNIPGLGLSFGLDTKKTRIWSGGFRLVMGLGVKGKDKQSLKFNLPKKSDGSKPFTPFSNTGILPLSADDNVQKR